jgi:hypothetical protein
VFGQDFCSNVCPPTLSIGEYCVINYFNEDSVHIIPIYGNLLVAAYVSVVMMNYMLGAESSHSLLNIKNDCEALIMIKNKQTYVHKETIIILMDTIKKEGKKTLVFGKKGHIIKNLL